MEEKNVDSRGIWGSRFIFILAAVGSAVGLGNAWRFPGLAAKYGGGSFLVVYMLIMFLFGIPLLMLEIAIGRKTRKGVVLSIKSINPKAEWFGWSVSTNGFVIVTYYSVVFAWVILMGIISFKFSNFTANTEAAKNLWADTISTTWTTKGFTHLSIPVLFSLVFAWILIYYCIRNGVKSVGKVVKFTVFTPVVCLLIMAFKGMMMPGGLEGLHKFFYLDVALLKTPDIWIDACGQVFYSLSIMMTVMFAYGSYLPKESNIAVDSIIIAMADLGTSVLSGIVMFTTMGGTGMLDNITDSGVSTAFIIYPQAIVSLTNNGYVNAVFAFIFYLCLATLAIDSSFSIIEGISASLSDVYGFNPKKVTRRVCVVSGLVSIVFATSAGLALLDIVDYYTNSVILVLIGIIETIIMGWLFKPQKILVEVNKNTTRFKMPKCIFVTSIKFIAPNILVIFFVWNMYDLIVKQHGLYNNYPLWANIVFGWVVLALVFASGIIVKKLEKKVLKRNEQIKQWDDI